MDEAIRDQFNQVLIKHIERLTGSRNAVGGLPLNLDNIGPFILFGGRELEMSDINSTVSERYSMEEFLKDAKETGIEQDENFQNALDEMTKRKYIDNRPEGRVHAYQDTKDTARLLNRIFPKMQGLNLLAYIWQTITEAVNGRTDLPSALSRFDQTLDHHGVIPPKPKIPVIQRDKSKPQTQDEEKSQSKLDSKNRRIIRDYVVSDAPFKEKKMFSDEFPETVEKHAEMDQKIQEETAVIKQKIAELEQTIAQAEKEKKAAQVEAAAARAKAAAEEGGIVDDEIAGKIAAFEKELALACPLCKTGVLQEKSTAAGKVFYACETKNCNFISWGKPHHIECGRCKNPFLVEAKDATGQTILRCPRATCQYRQALSSGGIKVVRKRVVRR
jgi:hypothetical protein